MLAPRVFQFFVFEHHQRAANAFTGLTGQDHVVNESTRTSHKRVGKTGFVFGLFRRQLLGVALVFAEDDLHRTFGAHDRNLRVRPGEVDIAAQVLGGHHVIRAAVSLARDHGDFGDGTFGVGVQQLRSMLDDAAELLGGARHKTGHIHKRDHRNIERVAKTDKAGSLGAALDVQATGQHQRLVGNNANRLPIHAGKADQDVFGVVGLQLKEVAVVHGFDDQLLHVVSLVRVVRHQGVQAGVHAVRRITAVA